MQYQILSASPRICRYNFKGHYVTALVRSDNLIGLPAVLPPLAVCGITLVTTALYEIAKLGFLALYNHGYCGNCFYFQCTSKIMGIV